MVRTKVQKDVDPNLSLAQTKYPCLVCKQGGRIIGHMGDIELTYCGHHRKYGERVLNFLINSIFHYKLSEFLKDTKEDIFMKNMPRLSDEDYKLLAEYVNTKIEELDEIQKWHKKSKHK